MGACLVAAILPIMVLLPAAALASQPQSRSCASQSPLDITPAFSFQVDYVPPLMPRPPVELTASGYSKVVLGATGRPTIPGGAVQGKHGAYR